MTNAKNKTKKHDILEFRLKTSIYSQEAVIGTCYVFIDRVYVHLDSKKKGEILVEMRLKDGANKKKLEDIIHPMVREEIQKRAKDHKGVLILDVPLLFESGCDDLTNENIVVFAR